MVGGGCGRRRPWNREKVAHLKWNGKKLAKKDLVATKPNASANPSFPANQNEKTQV